MIFGLIIHAGTIPEQDETDLLTAFEVVPGALLGMAAVWFLGVRSEESHVHDYDYVTPPRFLAAISTPFAEDGSVALDAFGEHVRRLADAGLDGVFVAGTTGEGVLLGDDEIAR